MFPQTPAEDLEKALKSNLTIDFTIDELLSSCSVESAGKSGKSCLLNALGETCNSILFQEQMYTHNKQTKQENLRITLNLYLYVPLIHQLRCKYIAAALVTLHGGCDKDCSDVFAS